MVGRIVIADGRVEAPSAGREITVHPVGELIAFNVYPELVGIVRTENNLREEAQVIGKLGRHEQIELACLKGGMRRRQLISARSAAVVSDRKDQRIGDGSDAEVEVEESSDI